MIIRDLQNLLRCPICMVANSFAFEDNNEPDNARGSFICNGCRHKFTFQNGILDLLSIDFSYLKNQAWRSKLALHQKWWTGERLKLKHGIAGRKWSPSTTLIKKYLSLNSIDTGRNRIALDVGCGSGERYKNFYKMTYIGIDPLALKQSYPFPFLKGIAEILPFVDNSIDVITAIESIDHFIDPKCSIKEMLRCLAPGGSLFIFVGDFAIKNEVYIDRQRLFTITEDDVHTYNYSTDYFREKLVNYFEAFEVDRENGYLAIWGWNKNTKKGGYLCQNK